MQNKYSSPHQNLSSKKEGTSECGQLYYTPSKLAQNAIYRDAVTLKKYQNQNNKLRQLQALNNYLQDRVKQIQGQKDGIQTLLTQQITMYKKIIHQMENNHQSTIKELQRKSNNQIHQLIGQKQNDAKYAQSQKQLLQLQIQKLIKENQMLKSQISHGNKNYDEQKKQHQKLKKDNNNLAQKIIKIQQSMKQQIQINKKQNDQLSRKLYNAQVDWKNRLQKQINKKNKQIQDLQKQFRAQLSDIQIKRQNNKLMKNQEINELRNTFQQESKRLNQFINTKNQIITNLNNQNNNQKNKVLLLTKKYENEVNNLSHQKVKLLEEIEKVSKENTILNYKIIDIQKQFSKEKIKLLDCIKLLKQQLQINQQNLAQQIERARIIQINMKNQMKKIKIENQNVSYISNQNQILNREIKNLKDLLLESSIEMDKCKQQFLKIGVQKDYLIAKLKQFQLQNSTLNRINLNREEQAKEWKKNYFIQRIYK